MKTTTNNALTQTQARELTEALGNTIAFGDHLKRVSIDHALNLDGYDDETAKEIRSIMFEDDMPSECPAYVESFNMMIDELSGMEVIDRLALDSTGTQMHRKNSDDVTLDQLTGGSQSNLCLVLDNLPMFVGTAACWKSGFDSVKFDRHQTKAIKARTYHDIEEVIFDKAGRVKSLNGDKKPRRQRVARRTPRK